MQFTTTKGEHKDKNFILSLPSKFVGAFETKIMPIATFPAIGKRRLID